MPLEMLITRQREPPLRLERCLNLDRMREGLITGLDSISVLPPHMRSARGGSGPHQWIARSGIQAWVWSRCAAMKKTNSLVGMSTVSGKSIDISRTAIIAARSSTIPIAPESFSTLRYASSETCKLTFGMAWLYCGPAVHKKSRSRARTCSWCHARRAISEGRPCEVSRLGVSSERGLHEDLD